MNKKQKWNYIKNKYDGFLIDIRFDFNRLSEYGFNISDGEFATFAITQGHINEHMLIYKNIRRPRWIDIPSLIHKRSISMVKSMYEDGILEPMKWNDYDAWRKINCDTNNILLK